MSIRIKYFITIFFIVLFLSVVFFAVISPIVGKKFDAHEIMSATRKIKQVQGVFNYQFEFLRHITEDLANWHDIVHIIEHDSQEDLPKTFINNVFVKSSRVDVLVTLNKEKQLTNSLYRDRNNNSIKEIHPDLVKAILAHEKFFHKNEEETDENSISITPFGGRYLVTSASIVTKTNNDEISGILVLGKFLDEEAITYLQEITQYSIDFFPLNTGPPEVIEAAEKILISPDPYLLEFVSEDIIKGYAMLKDASGEGVLMMVLTINRYLFKEHHSNLPFLFKAIIVCSLIFGIILYLFLDYGILRRFSSLTSDIENIEKTGIAGSRLPQDPRSDEFGKLTKSINDMLATNEIFEEYKVKTKRLESVATFAAGASHELSTPLSTLAVASGEMLRSLLKGNITSEELYDDLFLIREQVDRCKYIVNQIATNTGSHLGEDNSDFPLDQLLDDTLIQFKQSEIDLIQIENQVENKRFLMPYQSFCRVLRGLIRNALEASDFEKKILVTCDENNTHFILTVHDEGKGMDADTIKHATDPFFSTKNPGKNLGLGLFLAQSLAGRFNGDLIINSTLEQGSTVTISFAKDKSYAD